MVLTESVLSFGSDHSGIDLPAESPHTQNWSSRQKSVFETVKHHIKTCATTPELTAAEVVKCLKTVQRKTKAVLERDPNLIATTPTRHFVEDVIGLIEQFKRNEQVTGLWSNSISLDQAFTKTINNIKGNYRYQSNLGRDGMDALPGVPRAAGRHRILPRRL